MVRFGYPEQIQIVILSHIDEFTDTGVWAKGLIYIHESSWY